MKVPTRSIGRGGDDGVVSLGAVIRRSFMVAEREGFEPSVEILVPTTV